MNFVKMSSLIFIIPINIKPDKMSLNVKLGGTSRIFTVQKKLSYFPLQNEKQLMGRDNSMGKLRTWISRKSFSPRNAP